MKREDEQRFDDTLPPRVGPGRVGSYRIHERIGEGAFGVVYRAEQSEPVHRSVAVKILKQGIDSSQALARFDAERQALAMMQHPNIAQIFDAGVSESGRPYFVMEFLRGLPITDYCDQQHLPNRIRIEIFIDVCRALQHAHAKGIIHRDVKPSNVLVSAIDGKHVPKVIDFGVAKATRHELTARSLHTKPGSMLGTPGYMSPEQAELNESTIDTRTDVYSLGVLLYELLTGCLPLDPSEIAAKGYREVVRLIQEQDPPRLTTRVTASDAVTVASKRSEDEKTLLLELDGDLEFIVQRALEKDPARRYETANGLAADLRRFLQHEPVRARAPTTGYLVRKFVSRNRIAVFAGTIVVAAVLVGLGLALWQWSIAEQRWTQANDALAAENAALAAESRALAAFRRMQDVPLVDDLLLAADEALWPAHPAKVEAMDQWIDEARSFAARVPAHRRALADLRRQQTRASDFDDHFLLDVVEKLVAKCDRLLGPRGRISEVVRRRNRAATLEERSILQRQHDWSAAIARVATNPRYAPMRQLQPQLGLVALGPDPTSELEEFALLDSGEVPSRDSVGRLVLSEDAGLVFVLVPPGTFWMGAQARDAQGRNYDARALPPEGPVHEVRLDAFFMSKFEMTQAQWIQLMGENPSFTRVGMRRGAHEITLRNPVERVDWHACHRAMLRIACQLPTEAQWEYAARAGTDTPWWTGRDSSSLQGSANIADAETVAIRFRRAEFDVGLDDGHVGHARVGCFRANAFGLHDVIGNVYEWCSDYLGSYDLPVRPGDGFRSAEHDLTRAYRGGNYTFSSSYARSASRAGYRPVKTGLGLGLRPSRRVIR